MIDQVEEHDTIKFITRLHDGHIIESVIIPMKQYNTLCVSTQAGCRMGCIFCQTARSGFQRDLTTWEITGQLFTARFLIKKNINNIVFMGMGEPLDNMEAVTRAIAVFNEPHGFDVALRHMTLSTCGLVPGIKQLGELNLSRLNLAVSINSAENTLRSRLMPINAKYPLTLLKSALAAHPLVARRVILIEYILFKNLNDSKEDAQKLAAYLGGLKVRVNLIGFNPGSIQRQNSSVDNRVDQHEDNTSLKQTYSSTLPEEDKWNSVKGEPERNGNPLMLLPPEDDDIHRFALILESLGVFVVKRWGKGQNLQAGCGQLSAKR